MAIASRPTSLPGLQHIHIHTICCRITETYNIGINFLTYNFSKEHFLLPEDDLRQCFSTFVSPRPGKFFFIR